MGEALRNGWRWLFGWKASGCDLGVRFRLCVTQNYDVDTPILGTSLSSRVVGNGMVLRISGCGQPVGSKPIPQDQQAHQFRGPRGRKFPVGNHVSGVDGNVVGVSF